MPQRDTGLTASRRADADQEVLRANDSKLENGQPVLLPGGKVGKGKNYAAPDLRRFV